MKRIVAALAITALMSQSLMAAELGAAQLSVTKGQVLVNKGNGYKAVTGTTSLSSGDRVIVTDGEARLAHSSGCTATLSSQSMLTINKDTNCQAKMAGNVEIVAADLPARVAPAAQPIVAAPVAAPVLFNPGLIAFGVAAAVGIGVGVGTIDDDDNDRDPAPAPVSP